LRDNDAIDHRGPRGCHHTALHRDERRLLYQRSAAADPVYRRKDVSLYPFDLTADIGLSLNRVRAFIARRGIKPGRRESSFTGAGWLGIDGGIP
jgi:hypothetical protein